MIPDPDSGFKGKHNLFGSVFDPKRFYGILIRIRNNFPDPYSDPFLIRKDFPALSFGSE
jgi:hypothetical protein